MMVKLFRYVQHTVLEELLYLYPDLASLATFYFCIVQIFAHSFAKLCGMMVFVIFLIKSIMKKNSSLSLLSFHFFTGKG